MAFNVSSDLRLVPGVSGDAATSTQPLEPRDTVDELVHSLAVAPLSPDVDLPAIQEDEFYDRVRPLFEHIYDSQDRQMEVDLFHQAVQGDAEAQYQLGASLDDYRTSRGGVSGRPGPLSEEDITRFFRLAADQRHIEAQAELAFRYQRGLGVRDNCLEAAKWYARSIENSPDAEHKMDRYAFLGVLFADGGSDLPQDARTARLFFRKAAEQNNPYAKELLESLCTKNA